MKFLRFCSAAFFAYCLLLALTPAAFAAPSGSVIFPGVVQGDHQNLVAPLKATLNGDGTYSLNISTGTAAGDASAANQTAVQAAPGNDATSANAVQGVTNGKPVAVKQQMLTWTQSVVTLTAATSATLIAANTSRKALRWMVSGLNPVTVAPGLVTVVAGAGMNYSPASASGFQGGSDSFAGELSTQAFSAISTGGTTVVIWEGL